MLEAKLQHASIFKKLFEAIKDMVEEVNLDCDESGLKLQAMDNSHVALVSMILEEGGFLHYRCDRNRSLGLHLTSVCKVFKLCNNNDSVSLQSDDDAEHVTFVFENPGEERLSTFSLRLMALEQDALGIPEDENQDAEVVLSSKDYISIVRNMMEFSDTLKIEIDKNSVKFVTHGDIGAGEVLLKQKDPSTDDPIGVQIKANRPVSQTYATKFLNYFGKAGGLSDSVTITLSVMRPIEVKFKILDNVESSAEAKPQIGTVKFYLAPKMDEDDAHQGDSSGGSNDTSMD